MATVILIVTILLIGAMVVGFIIVYGHNISSRQGGTDAANAQMREYIAGLNESNQRAIASMQENHRRELQELRQHWEERVKVIERESQIRLGEMSRQTTLQGIENLKNTNSEQMEQVLAPLRERLETLSALVQRAQVDSEASSRTLTSRIEQLSQMNDLLGREAKNLTEALRGNSKVQGDWGELRLETLLQEAGLQRDVNYRAQVTKDADGKVLRGEGGELQRPDFIIDLPDDRHVIVDSKVSLKDYVDYCAAEDVEQRKAAGMRHVASVRRHVDELKNKKYQKSVRNALEHVLMFIPNEGAFVAAVTLDSDLWQYAFRGGVVIVSAAHLLSTLQLIGQLWREDRQNRNAAEIARVAGLMHDSVKTFAARFDRVGTQLATTVKVYEETRNMLSETNQQSLLNRAARLKDLGAKTTR